MRHDGRQNGGWMPERDVFLCHAHYDKSEYARPLAAALGWRGVSCWVDEAQIGPGDSIIEAVSEGLENARYVVVLITERFLARNWTQKELNSALSREIRTGVPIVIPVVSIPHGEFAHRYPLLADKLSLRWSEGPDAIAAKIAARFDRAPAAEWHYVHPTDYVGLVWTRVVPTEPGRTHKVTLRWGPYIKTTRFKADSPVSLVHHKTNSDNIMLHVSVEPEAIVTFGQGAAPDEGQTNIDEGWTRTAEGAWTGYR
jgi:hypothetical protein